MEHSLGKNARRVHVGLDVNISDRKKKNQDWLAEQASKRTEQEVADCTAMSPRAVGNLRQKRNKISFDNFVEWCLNDPHFAADFAEYVGVIKPGSAEFAATMTKAINAYQRMGGDE